MTSPAHDAQSYFQSSSPYFGKSIGGKCDLLIAGSIVKKNCPVQNNKEYVAPMDLKRPMSDQLFLEMIMTDFLLNSSQYFTIYCMTDMI